MPHIKINQPNVSIFGSTVEIDGEILHGVKSMDYHASVDDNETPVVTLGIRPKSGFELDAECHVIIEEFHTIHEAVLVLKKAISEDSELRKAFIASIASVLKPKETYFDGDGTYKIITGSGAESLAEEILGRIIGED